MQVELKQKQFGEDADFSPGVSEKRREEGEFAVLKQNLLELAEGWSEKYDEEYDKPFFASRAYLEFERSIICDLIQKIDNKVLLVDLGCATGRCLFSHCDSFQSSIGFDLSEHMIRKAEANAKASHYQSVAFKKHDLDLGIPLKENSTSLIVMSMGAASDIRNIRHVIDEIERVLLPGGRFLLSFYNAEALLYSGFFPWETGLAAQIDVYKRCLTVHKGEEVYEIYAHPFQPEEVRLLLSVNLSLTVDLVSTYPTLSAVLPKDLLENPAVQKIVNPLDEVLSSGVNGAYVIVTGIKKG